ncbi:hypothetical protein BDV25DRAFT_136343 [Aspergillus avenaceus]|uniref:Uncharacterized protein n=1 Tax=Aspergillus avenaceus TaxID=36643 RepID=A0A5N6U5Q6_ASPAV|nr:hypothetical protein BDV25DRAFT_136343 [Aspergillus avenaceus]
MKLNLGLLLVAVQAATAISAGASEVQGTSPPAKDLFAPKACWTRSPYGCSENRWCWKQCGPGGKWCWLAKNGGRGEWKSCTSAEDCKPGVDDSDCGKGGKDCKACGCGC